MVEQCPGCKERRQLDLIQSIGRVGYWEYDPAQQSMSLPKPAQALLSAITENSLISCRSLQDVLPDAERKRFQLALDQAVATRHPLILELRLATRNGKNVHLLIRGAPMPDDADETLFVGTFHDITHEKQIENEREKVITQFQALLEALPQGVSVIDSDLRLILWNRRFSEILNFPQKLVHRHTQFEEFIRHNALRGDYGPGDPEEQIRTIVDRARKFLPHQFERTLPGGRTVLVEGIPFKFGGEVSGFVTTYTDITERKKTDDQLTRQLDVMKTIIENFPGAISLFDADLRLAAYNEQFKHFLDFPDSIFENREVYFEDLARFNVGRGEYGPGDPETQVAEILERTRNIQPHKFERLCSNGMALEIRGNPMPSGGFVSTYIDITERKRIETELVHAKETAEARSEQVSNLLNNSGQGFLSFGEDLIVDAEYSLACETMLGESPEGKNAAKLFFDNDPIKADLFCSTILSVVAESDPDIRGIMLSLLPTEILHDEAWLKTEYKALDNNRFMVVLTDITAERYLTASLGKERHRLELIVSAISDSRNFFDMVSGFTEFLATGLSHLLESTATPKIIARELYREIHTYKGLLNQFSFPSTPTALHDIESNLSEAIAQKEGLTAQKIADLISSEALQSVFQKDLAILSEVLGEEFLTNGEHISLSSDQAVQLEALAKRILRGESIDSSVAEIRQLLEAMCALRKVSLRDVLMGFDSVIAQAAKGIGKKVLPISVEGDADIWIDPQTYRLFFRSLIHVFRNAVAHGLETPDVRWEAEKDEGGKITCTIAANDQNIMLSISDDGAGINLNVLRQRAVANGIYDAGSVLRVSDEEITQLIFMDNISTQSEVDELAGRGVGLAAVLSEVTNLKGGVAVKTVAGLGTEFLFTLPLKQDGLKGVS